MYTVGIHGLLGIGAGAVIFGFIESLWLGAAGGAMIVGSWLLARIEPGAYRNAFIGTGYFGAIETSDGKIFTKWLYLVLPLLPVRSYHVLDERPGVSVLPTWKGATVPNPYESVTHYALSPLPGLGIFWLSVLETVLWPVFCFTED